MLKLLPLLVSLAAAATHHHHAPVHTIVSTVLLDYNAVGGCPCGYVPTAAPSSAAAPSASDNCTDSTSATAAYTGAPNIASSVPTTLATSLTANAPASSNAPAQPLPASNTIPGVPPAPPVPTNDGDACVGPTTLGADCSATQGCCVCSMYFSLLS